MHAQAKEPESPAPTAKKTKASPLPRVATLLQDGFQAATKRALEKTKSATSIAFKGLSPRKGQPVPDESAASTPQASKIATGSSRPSSRPQTPRSSQVKQGTSPQRESSSQGPSPSTSTFRLSLGSAMGINFISERRRSSAAAAPGGKRGLRPTGLHSTRNRASWAMPAVPHICLHCYIPHSLGLGHACFFALLFPDLILRTSLICNKQGEHLMTARQSNVLELKSAAHMRCAGGSTPSPRPSQVLQPQGSHGSPARPSRSSLPAPGSSQATSMSFEAWMAGQDAADTGDADMPDAGEGQRGGEAMPDSAPSSLRPSQVISSGGAWNRWACW